MKSVDTNVLIRVLLRDDPSQSTLAEKIFDDGVFVPLTVLLETGWLLRSRYRFSRIEVAKSLRAILDMPDVTVEDATGAGWAVERFEKAGDLADLIHLVASADADAFVTFDRALARGAGTQTPVPIETLKA